MKARQHMLCPIFTIIITCVCLLLSEETSAEKFLEFYSKDADDAMLTADASILADLERHFDDFVSEKLPVASRSTLASLKNELAGSFAENERLQRAFDGSKKKKSILENLAELFEVVGLFKNGKRTKENEIINEILDSLKEQIAALRRTGRKNAGHTKEDLITMKEDEGFNNEIIEVLFFKTAMRRKALKKGHLVDVVSRVGYHYTVPLREVVDEIVWLCELGGCVNANKFNPVGWFGRRKLQSELHSETLYSRLCIVRVKVLLYIAYLQESRLDYKERSFREKLSNKINCGPKSFVGVLSLAAIIAAAGYHHFLKSASASSRANGSNEQPSWPPPLTTEWTILGMSTSAAALTALGAVCLLGGGFAYYSYYADSTSEMADNGEHNDGNEGNEKGAAGGGGSSDQQTTTGGLRSTISSVVFSALGMSKEEKKKKRKKPKEKMMGSAFSKHASSVDDTEDGVRREGPPGKQDLRTASSAIFSKVAKTKVEKVNEEEEEENEEDVRAISTIRPLKEKPTLQGPLVPVATVAKKRGKGAEKKAVSVSVVKKKPSLLSSIFSKRASIKVSNAKQKPTKQSRISLNLFRTLMKKRRRAPSSEIPPTSSSSATSHHQQHSPTSAIKTTAAKRTATTPLKGKQPKRAPSFIIPQSSVVEQQSQQPAPSSTLRPNTVQKAFPLQAPPFPSEHQHPSTVVTPSAVPSSTAYHTATPPPNDTQAAKPK